mmetsp:Transcript_81513/g.136450  ORF Transcript_81513/g.136450 Transcript_81513/m.136450 type:complete len:259 (+) Transcript_81513:1006-1782(+)
MQRGRAGGSGGREDAPHCGTEGGTGPGCSRGNRQAVQSGMAAVPTGPMLPAGLATAREAEGIPKCCWTRRGARYSTLSGLAGRLWQTSVTLSASHSPQLLHLPLPVLRAPGHPRPALSWATLKGRTALAMGPLLLWQNTNHKPWPAETGRWEEHENITERREGGREASRRRGGESPFGSLTCLTRNDSERARLICQHSESWLHPFHVHVDAESLVNVPHDFAASDCAHLRPGQTTPRVGPEVSLPHRQGEAHELYRTR